jgi:hypothetical protein
VLPRPRAASVRVEVRRVSAEPRLTLPAVDDLLPKLLEAVSEMGAEGPEWLAYQAAAQDLVRLFLDTAPLGARIGSGVCCSGGGVQVSEGSVSYYTIRVVGADPATAPAPVYRSSAGAVSRQGTLDRPGRMGGAFGWSADRDLIAGALASYVHNWVAMLLAYFKRPSLPLTRAWRLPNLTLSETRAPSQFHPAASFTFRHPPTPLAVYRIGISSETPGKVGLDWWYADKSDLARVDEVEFDAGSNEIIAYVALPPVVTEGYFTINVLDAPKGVTVEYVDTAPPCF